MTFQQLKYVLEVARVSSITEASKRFFVSQPSLTASIKDLEEELGIRIFERSSKGVNLTHEGEEFLSYARQGQEQFLLMEERYKGNHEERALFSVSCQHYSFAVNAFVDVIRQFGGNRYDFTLRETQTYEIIEDVAHLKSELGVLYTSSKNRDVLMRLLKKNDLVFEKLFTAKLHVFISSKNPLAKKKRITLKDLAPYPYLTYEQGEHNSFYFSEEPLPAIDCEKSIKVRDRATLFNLLIGLDGYTVCSGVISHKLNGRQIVSRPLAVDEHMCIGLVSKKGVPSSRYAECYRESIRRYCTQKEES